VERICESFCASDDVFRRYFVDAWVLHKLVEDRIDVVVPRNPNALDRSYHAMATTPVPRDRSNPLLLFL
jgi:hypothetical protein